jgi:hypothetical protein
MSTIQEIDQTSISVDCAFFNRQFQTDPYLIPRITISLSLMLKYKWNFNLL